MQSNVVDFKGQMPRLPLEEAIVLAKNYLRDHCIDTSSRSLLQVKWCMHPSRGEFWYLAWYTEQQFEFSYQNLLAKGGGMLCVEVADSGTVSHSYCR